jgi:hypothetical protein
MNHLKTMIFTSIHRVYKVMDDVKHLCLVYNNKHGQWVVTTCDEKSKHIMNCYYKFKGLTPILKLYKNFNHLKLTFSISYLIVFFHCKFQLLSEKRRNMYILNLLKDLRTLLSSNVTIVNVRSTLSEWMQWAHF